MSEIVETLHKVQNSKKYQFRQTANDIFYKMMILKLFERLRQLADVEGGVFNDSPKFDKLTLTVLKFMSFAKTLNYFISVSADKF